MFSVQIDRQKKWNIRGNKILQCTQNVVVNFNDVIRIAHCALNTELIPVAILIFEWTLLVTKNTVLLCGFKDARLERFRFKYYYNSIT